MTAPTMTKKHFVFLAEALAEARATMPVGDSPPAPDEVLDYAIDVLVQHLSATNTQFDRARFMEACNYGQRVLSYEPR